ncbi:MAG TPA: MerR family transcriptional regulator [Dongiaceae bacterium]|jgi:DNA-binding transcriptional MerR regulator/effector-binding domain-containing protein
MFRIGEFSQIARVSGRLLRYYDSIGLLRPLRIDPASGYRYYSASQLPRLNRILALKELGLSLDQIAKLVDDKVEAGEIRGMLMLRKAELERTLEEESARLRHIESRLRQIEEQGALKDYDILLKSVPALPFLSIRGELAGMGEAVAMVGAVAGAVAARVPLSLRQNIVVVAHSDFDDENLDLEIGVTLQRGFNGTVRLPDRREMNQGELPAIDHMAAIVRPGPPDQSHAAFGALGQWMEANGYGIAGPCREVFLELPPSPQESHKAVMEIQFPVSKPP